ncbi:hypothetical protein BS34A_23870 [Bacillus subtilis]|nr:hypothetical protein GP2222_23170 [Bacillus subtilis subsp. subtilis str. 168]KIX81229.1 hypothetical protein TV00_03012 [Bacillus subtilis]BBK72893.1 hypothetical protein NBRC13719_22380 [Bacillus subtilis subsp. subtilis]AQR86387.1 hypothetical protein GP2223_23180 [Bacillus subtilis subsp. subtilis str. 168]WLE12836.1 hypothetical protein FPL20_GE02593 [Bacillus subtilis]
MILTQMKLFMQSLNGGYKIDLYNRELQRALNLHFWWICKVIYLVKEIKE